jgi:hypothetical protein
MPTATDALDALDSGKWQLGLAAVAVSNLTPTLLAGALVTWQASVAGDDDRDDTGLLTAQPLAITEVGRRSPELMNEIRQEHHER